MEHKGSMIKNVVSSWGIHDGNSDIESTGRQDSKGSKDGQAGPIGSRSSWSQRQLLGMPQVRRFITELDLAQTVRPHDGDFMQSDHEHTIGSMSSARTAMLEKIEGLPEVLNMAKDALVEQAVNMQTEMRHFKDQLEQRISTQLDDHKQSFTGQLDDHKRCFVEQLDDLKQSFQLVTNKFESTPPNSSVREKGVQEQPLAPSIRTQTNAKPLEEHTYIEAVGDTKDESAINVMSRATWELGQLDKAETLHSWFTLACERKIHERSIIHRILEKIGLLYLLPTSRPKNIFSAFAQSRYFHGTVATVIALNTIFGTIVADQSMRNLLKESPEELPKWWDVVDDAFTYFFAAELLFRMCCLRLWFFLDPAYWKWNVFDLLLVTSSAVADNLSQIDAFRFLRIFRIARVARVLRLVENFTELRKLMFALLACLYALFWAALFLLFTMFVFALFILQGLKSRLSERGGTPEFMEAVHEYFDGFVGCFTTLYVVLAGDEWLAPHKPLAELGFVYGSVMPAFVLFVNIGVMNVVVGVFAEAASRCKDRDLVAQDQIANVQDFAGDMLQLFHDLAPKDGGRIAWEQLSTYLHKQDVQAYFAHHQLDASHAHLIYELCDKDHNDTVGIRELIIGLLRIKGEAKALDQRVLAHAIGAVAKDVGDMWQELKQVVSWTRPPDI